MNIKQNQISTKKSLLHKLMLFFLIINLLNYCLCEDCPRDKPILKKGQCVSEYCSYEEFENKICVVSNPFIKTQWLNEIHTFTLEPLSDICTATNWQGDLFLMGQGYSEDNHRNKYLYAFYKNGNGLFYDDELEYHYSFETIQMPEDRKPETFYSVHIDDKQYLLSSQVENEMFLIDFYNKNYTIFTLNTYNHYSGTLLRLKGYYDDEEIDDEDERVYFTDYTNCLDRDSYNDCFLALRIFRFSLTDLTIEKEVNMEIQINPLSRETCFQNADLYIQCVYTSYSKETNVYNRVVSLFDYKTLELVHTEMLEDDIDPQISFDSTLQMKGNFFVTGYSYPKDLNILKLLLKKFVVEKNGDETKITLENYLPNVEVVFINELKEYSIEKGISKRNSMVKISDTKFAVLINEYSDSREDSSWNKKLLILICTIFNDSRLSIRYYRINFELYDLLIYEDLRGYTLDNFFGILVESVVGEQSFSPRPIFLTFGYVNSTYEDTVDKFLKLNDSDSVIELNKYITGIENNLFGYKFLGVKILKLPNPNKSGYFVKQKTNEIVYEGDIVSVDTVLRFILSRKLAIEDEFTIQFAGAVQEPTYDEMNENAEKVEMYPINNIESERLFYTPRILLGRLVNYVFEIRCFESCKGCTRLSTDPTDQYCIHCKPGYHFEEGTNNCIQEISCHPNCGTCFAPPDSKNNMNCLSCQEDFHYFEETNSCLNCPKYVSIDLKECIDEIPQGYYLQDSELGTLGVCHELCKTCNEGPELWGMHCTECKYHSEKFVPEYDGDCPTENYDEEVEEEEEGGECPRDKPILVRLDFCDMVYCSPQEYEDSICIVDNTYVKNQWFNNIQRLGEGNIVYPSATYGVDGKFILFGTKIDPSADTYKNVIYGTDIIGQPLFHDANKNTNTYYKSIEFPENVYLESIRLVENFENNKTFLLSTQIGNNMYGINYNTGEIKTYTFDVKSHASDDIFIFKNEEEYFTNFINCQESLEDCYMMLRKFKLNSDDEIEIIKESKPVEEINSETNFICIPGFEDYIQCVYTSVEGEYYMHKIGYFDYDSLELKYSIDIEGNFSPEAFFDSMIWLNDEAFVVAYSVEKNIVKVLIKPLEFYVDQNVPVVGNYINGVSHILLNEDNYFNFNYKEGMEDMNSMCRINDYKFAVLLNSFNGMKEGTQENSEIIIYIFNIFNDKKNVNVREYVINFKLYNMVNYGKVYGYSLDQFFGIILELSSPEDRKLVNTAFVTFGYVNTTGESSIMDKEFVTGNSAYSKVIKFSDYIKTIENNLFGYEFLGVFILNLPDSSVGTFVDEEKKEIFMSNTYKLETEIQLEVNTKRTYDSGIYTVTFAGAVQEPDIDEIDMHANTVYFYPLEDLETEERDFYSPQTYLGRTFEYNFELTGGIGKPEEKEEEEEEEEVIDDNGCYPSCESCYKNSKDDEDHQCKVCKTDYYFKEDTHNCYKEINEYYYFDEEKEIFSPCYIDCVTCSGKADSLFQMNCLSCEEEFNFYDKSKNCLKCPKYVNYEQTDCLEEIPEGYYLLDKRLGTIEKCNEFCKTCSEGESYDENDNLYMNCDSCKYESTNFVPKHEGDCPTSPDDKPVTDDEPVDGQCPKEKPILKQNKCQNIYCTEKEFENGTCEIYNNYVKTQWLNKFNIFDENLSSFVSYDTNDKGEIYFMAQREDDKTFKKYVYGFDSKGRGVLYDKDKKKYVSFKTFSSKFSGYTEKAKYIEINNEKYLLNMLKDKKLYLININTDEVISHEFEYTPYSIDKLFKLSGISNVYIFDFIYCIDEVVLDKCYVGFANYKIEDKNSFFLQKTNSDEETLKVNYETKLTCFKNSYDIIQCTYSLNEDQDDYYEYILGLFNQNSLKQIQDFTINNTINQHPTFDSMIELKDNAFIVAYSIETNMIKVLFKKLDFKDGKYSLSNYLESIDEIIINEDKSYVLEGGNCFRNSLFKLSDDEFVILINDNKDGTGYSSINNAMVIITFKIYNSNRNVLVRHYKIDFNLYNMFIDGDLMGYQLNGFFGVLAELTSPTEKYLSRAAFLTFGYINTTDDVEADIGTNNIITNNKKIKVKDYIITNIENNLFGYTFEGVKILSLPHETKAGFLMNSNYNNKKLKLDDIININSELSFIKSATPVDGEYSFSFAGLVKEPNFKEQNNYANKVVNYPNNVNPESYLSQQRTFVGREFKYSFIIGKKQEPIDDDPSKQNCYKNCKTCDSYSEEEDDQNCVTCKAGYYFKDGTKNCYVAAPSKTYFDKDINKWVPCHKNCLTCSGKATENQMNCLTCESGVNFYQKSKNCLKCPTFVNFNQTDCLPIIPKGYYLEDKQLGIIGKCYSLCETCDKGPSKTNNNLISMNCKTCLYENKSLKLSEGECPAAPGKQKGEGEKKEEEIEEDDAPRITLLIFTIITCAVLAVLIIGVIVFLICYNMRASKRKENNNDYFNIGGKDIPFEDENNNINNKRNYRNNDNDNDNDNDNNNYEIN